MIVPDHLDYHPDMDNYIQAKGNIFRFQNPEDTAVYNGMQPEVEQLAQLSPGHKIPYGKPEGGHLKAGAIWFGEQKICSISDVALLGQHNLDNVCAAVSATYGLIGELEPLARAIKGFKGLPHRLEVVGTIDGVRYINDSFAANPTAAAAAIKAIEGSKVAIIGGFDRGIDQSGLIKALKDGDVRHVLLIGQSAAKLAQVLVTAGQANFEEVEGDMDQIVGVASKAARPGETVLLSPGSPSFDMFKNFADRGNQFRAAVERLAQA